MMPTDNGSELKIHVSSQADTGYSQTDSLQRNPQQQPSEFYFEPAHKGISTGKSDMDPGYLP